jgi:hypothetical protein
MFNKLFFNFLHKISLCYYHYYIINAWSNKLFKMSIKYLISGTNTINYVWINPTLVFIVPLSFFSCFLYYFSSTKSSLLVSWFEFLLNLGKLTKIYTLLDALIQEPLTFFGFFLKLFHLKFFIMYFLIDTVYYGIRDQFFCFHIGSI